MIPRKQPITLEELYERVSDVLEQEQPDIPTLLNLCYHLIREAHEQLPLQMKLEAQDDMLKLHRMLKSDMRNFRNQQTIER